MNTYTIENFGAFRIIASNEDFDNDTYTITIRTPYATVVVGGQVVEGDDRMFRHGSVTAEEFEQLDYPGQNLREITVEDFFQMTGLNPDAAWWTPNVTSGNINSIDNYFNTGPDYDFFNEDDEDDVQVEDVDYEYQ